MNLIEESIEEFIKQTGFEKDDALELFTEYMTDLPSYIQNLVDAYNNKDFEELARLSHQYKGSSSNMRIQNLPELLKVLEISANSLNDDGCMSILNKIQNLVKEISELFKKL